jgi:hypothetical protein
MADVEKAVAEVRKRAMAQFTCEICGDGFEQRSRFERHMATSHPEKAPSASDVEKVLSGTQYPRTKRRSLSTTFQEECQMKS